MQSVAQLEASIQLLPTQDFLALAEWVTEQHVERLRRDDFESPELEAQMLQALDGPRYPVDPEFFNVLRQSWRSDNCE